MPTFKVHCDYRKPTYEEVENTLAYTSFVYCRCLDLYKEEPQEPKDIEIVVEPFTGDKLAKNILTDLRAKSLRPATIVEAYAFQVAYPALQVALPITGLEAWGEKRDAPVLTVYDSLQDKPSNRHCPLLVATFTCKDLEENITTIEDLFVKQNNVCPGCKCLGLKTWKEGKRRVCSCGFQWIPKSLNEKNLKAFREFYKESGGYVFT